MILAEVVVVLAVVVVPKEAAVPVESLMAMLVALRLVQLERRRLISPISATTPTPASSRSQAL
jgi:hypothetical protein